MISERDFVLNNFYNVMKYLKELDARHDADCIIDIRQKVLIEQKYRNELLEMKVKEQELKKKLEVEL